MIVSARNQKTGCLRPGKLSDSRGFSLVELLTVVVVLLVLSAISLPYIYNYQKLYKSEDQALRVMDLMREAGQLALTRRRTVRLELDLTENAVLLIDENGAGPDTRIKTVPLESTGDVRLDIAPSGVTRPTPPNYNDVAYASDNIGHDNGGTSVTGHNVWQARFRSDGSVVNAANTPISVTIYSWPPAAYGATTARNNKEIRAITMFGGSGAVRYWKYDGTTFKPYQ